MTAHPCLMSPLTLRGHTLRNRIVSGAHTANMSDQGLPGLRFGGYLLERALGGAAMIVAEPMPVHRSGVLTRGNFLNSTDEVIPHFRAVTDRVERFRLGGLQPRRRQILDLLDWYERQFTNLGVTLHLDTFLDAEDLAAHPADTIILATGSLPDPSCRQRWIPQEPILPGLDAAVWSPEEVLRREARLSDTVIVQDEGGNWRGAGTAWFLADQGKEVILVTPDPMVGKELTRTAADGPMRRALARLGVPTRTDHCIARWLGNGATLLNLLTGGEETVPASALVMATTNLAFDPFPETMPEKTLHRIGDCAAPRLAAYAFHEGRKLALAL
jgi:hypothetical protein